MQLHHQFIKSAKKYGKKLAINDYTTGKKITYSKSLIAALILMRKIKHHKDGFIGVMIPNSAGSFFTILGVLFAGKVPVMINYSTGAANNVEYAQKKGGFKTVITSKALLEKIGCRLVPGMVFIEDIMASISAADKLSALLKSFAPLKVLLKYVHHGDMDDNVVLLFTSGSEKDPKAVQLTHRNIHSNLTDIFKRIKVNDSDIVMANLPLFHVFGQTTNFWLPLVQGCTAVSYANPLEYEKVVDIIKAEKVTLLMGTPIFFMGYLKKSKTGDFASIRLAVGGADKTPDLLRKGYLDKHAIELLEGYGTTETSPVISLNFPGENKPGSIGKPLPSVMVKIVDINSDEEVARGQQGKLLVKGDLVMKGYFGDIEETSLRIHGGWYDTGDMGVMDEEGYLWHKGRLKRFIKIGGEMVSLVRTEAVLGEVLPDEVECCVVEIPDSVKGARIVATVTKKIDEKKILKQMSKTLPNISLPKQFVVIEELPKMGTGKVDFRGVTEMVKEKLTNNNK